MRKMGDGVDTLTPEGSTVLDWRPTPGSNNPTGFEHHPWIRGSHMDGVHIP